MVSYRTKYLAFLVLVLCAASFSSAHLAQQVTSNPGPTDKRAVGASQLRRGDLTMDMDICVEGENGEPIEVAASVTLGTATGQVLGQGATLGGHIRFTGIAVGAYTIQVVAPGYESVAKEYDGYNGGTPRIIIGMRPTSGGETGAGSILGRKAQKELGQALEALRANKPERARSHLEAAYQKVPNYPGVNYLFGVYFLQMKNSEKAQYYWVRTLEFNPKHVSALLSLAEALTRDQKFTEAEAYARRAVQADPMSWRAHAVLAAVFLKERSTADAINEADHALELGHGQAAIAQPLLALALRKSGDKERAVRVLEDYIHDHPNDAAARKQLEGMRAPDAQIASSDKNVAAAEVELTTMTESAPTLPLPSNWLPPDVDERVPPVQTGAACSLDEVMKKTGKRVEEFVTNVDRFAASEFIKHESINKWGFAERPETRRFDYAVSIQQYRPGYFDVVEYRGDEASLGEFPDGIETRGLPSMALIFHPNHAGNYAMSCEGLGLWNGTPAWQVHFRQRPDKPYTTREYKIGQTGPSYPVGLRGRAWIAADSYQIVRMETDLVAPLPEIRLLADHTVVEYGPVRFKNQDAEVWLPRTAEIYSDWRGMRMHRRHTFSKYILFSVDEKQQISEPKNANK